MATSGKVPPQKHVLIIMNEDQIIGERGRQPDGIGNVNKKSFWKDLLDLVSTFLT